MDRGPDCAAEEAPLPEPPEGHLAALNEAQCRAVAAVEGAVLVLAGAGTGKTRALTTRLAHILATGRAYPGARLAVPLTNQAARPIKERPHPIVARAPD